jgi:MerR family transcriptional regulator, copper efflux regulator
MDATYHIGEVAGRTGLSLRTLRHWEEMGLITPTGRSHGGFRLYIEEDVQRVLVARALKPADFSLEELQAVLGLRDRLRGELARADRVAAERELQAFLDRAELRCKLLRERLAAAELVIGSLRELIDGQFAGDDAGQAVPSQV